MKKIPLTQGQFALVDDEDFERLNAFKWHTHKTKHTFYARTDVKKRKIYMHREIINCENNLEVDHIDNNGLNNQKDNLRRCSRLENSRNCRLLKRNTSGLKGVSFHKERKKYYSRIKINEKVLFLGYFENQIDAVKKYDEAALKYHGNFAKLNKIY